MNDEDFEWDDAKAESNLKKHGISFEAARRIFDDVFALDRVDSTTDYGEDRYLITGLVNGMLLTAAYTERNGRTRIVSARKATKREEREYHRSQT
jgi:uncharacterized DUF497 family protein